MGGFKSGAADDDWGSTTANEGSESTAETETEADAADDTAEPAPDDTPDTAIQSSTDAAARSSQRDLPWVLTRNSITDGREQTVQLHLQQSTVDTQREATRTLESELGEQVKKADLREAALLVGLRHTDEIAATLREWGYDLE
ncbi:hypothetical protein [Halorubrum lipolyticum]|uniref:Uncharacterized protein n=1 Tax=Halorubrum lipolyticum DSM 21995 TaxID=1227482 RepID=M0NQ18_9EURY|nr:hypothetical protein [Halorubrum lipolyticum]EMA59723.1 hypothetical protein C469_10386 [Halorubrum lipolyticum DSM 21995]